MGPRPLKGRRPPVRAVTQVDVFQEWLDRNVAATTRSFAQYPYDRTSTWYNLTSFFQVQSDQETAHTSISRFSPPNAICFPPDAQQTAFISPFDETPCRVLCKEKAVQENEF